MRKERARDAAICGFFLINERLVGAGKKKPPGLSGGCEQS
jgi:hypothetical protein